MARLTGAGKAAGLGLHAWGLEVKRGFGVKSQWPVPGEEGVLLLHTQGKPLESEVRAWRSLGGISLWFSHLTLHQRHGEDLLKHGLLGAPPPPASDSVGQCGPENPRFPERWQASCRCLGTFRLGRPSSLLTPVQPGHGGERPLLPAGLHKGSERTHTTHHTMAPRC